MVATAEDATAVALEAARLVCADGVRTAFPPSTAGDDFAFFAGEAPGCYVWLGNGPARDGALHHNTAYDFCDEAIPTGIAYAIWSGVGTVMITLVGWVFMGQRLDLPALVGIGLIIAGVVVMNLFSGTVKH